MSLEEALNEFIEGGDDWERKRTSVDEVFILKLPEYKGNPPRLAIELNPTVSSGNPTKKRGLMMFNVGELEEFREMISEEGLDGVMETIMEVNPEKGRKKRPEEEVIEI